MTPAHLDMDKCMTIHLDYELPEYPAFEEGYRRAPRRESHLTEADKILAIKNALRYIHPDHHEQMAKEFAQELEEHGRIYGYRFRPEGKLYGKPIDEYKGNCINGGFGMVLDGSERVDQILKMSMPWDVMVGVARRGWAGNPNSLSTIAEYNKLYEGQDHITLPYLADDSIVHKALEDI